MEILEWQQGKEGEWVQPPRKNFYIQCCDCHLIHRVNFRLVNTGTYNKIQLQVFRADDVVTGEEATCP